ncbi:DUF4160 domain-containing protein [Acidiphilium iwatense]|uniref:DUF4160 domain-containing protein n=1 Tax=Acidiphilium iwatense TaxID=768198 RepID=A0ABS9DXG3_9PROT|nr:DUF4160 domain-containing protein [Acidiphilium iwatense]
MPTVLRIGGLRVVVYPNDHRPPHVHVTRYGNRGGVYFELSEWTAEPAREFRVFHGRTEPHRFGACCQSGSALWWMGADS